MVQSHVGSEAARRDDVDVAGPSARAAERPPSFAGESDTEKYRRGFRTGRGGRGLGAHCSGGTDGVRVKTEPIPCSICKIGSH